MATQSLYRRYRPQRFAEVKGQDHVVRALRNAVAEGREGQAYLFSGPRGTGKTSTARILAKALNCENPAEGEPCCECESCLAVERGTSYDVHELDAASHSGVDAMRTLIEKTSLGTPGRHKVYILDEVHMLSKAAEAALLKTLEEPPPHVVFVLATTDPQRMADTIRSRTQHLQFHLLPSEVLQEHIRWVAGEAGLDISDAAFDQVLIQGNGSARDALSALELAANSGDRLLEEAALDEFVEAMIEHDPGRALTMVGHAVDLGRDPRTLTEELIRYLRNGFLTLMAPDLVQLPSNQIDDLAAQSQRLGPPGLVRGIEHLGTALAEMRHAPDPRVLLDVATVKLTSDDVAPDVGAILVRLEKLEKQLAEGVSAAGAGGTSTQNASIRHKVDKVTGRATLGGRARKSADTAARPAADESASPPSNEAPAVDEAESADGDSADRSAAPVSASEVPPETAPEKSSATVPESISETVPASDVGPASEVVTETVESSASESLNTEAISIELWENSVRPSLKGMARAVFAPATYVRSTESSLTLSVPNAVHREKCEQHSAAVEAAIKSLLGTAVAVEIVDSDNGGGGGAGGGGPAESSGPRSSTTVRNLDQTAAIASADADDTTSRDAVTPHDESVPRAGEESEPAAASFQPDEEIDLDDLVDAPPESVKTPMDRLAEAFPGSELIEESG